MLRAERPTQFHGVTLSEQGSDRQPWSRGPRLDMRSLLNLSREHENKPDSETP